MPIKIKIKGSLSLGEPWTGYIGVASGLSSRVNPLDGVTPDPGETANPDQKPGKKPAQKPAGRPASFLPDPGGVQSELVEVELGPDPGSKVYADVHLVWSTPGVVSTSLPPGTSESFDGPSKTTRLLFKNIELQKGGSTSYNYSWSSAGIGLTTKPGVSHQFITAYLTLPGQDISAAVANDTALLPSPYAFFSWLKSLIYKMFG